jgi:hypothetical protein
MEEAGGRAQLGRWEGGEGGEGGGRGMVAVRAFRIQKNTGVPKFPRFKPGSCLLYPCRVRAGPSATSSPVRRSNKYLVDASRGGHTVQCLDSKCTRYLRH